MPRVAVALHRGDRRSRGSAVRHCGKAVVRSDLWSPSGTNAAAVTLGSNVFALENCEQPRLDMSVLEMNQLLDDGYSSVEPL